MKFLLSFLLVFFIGGSLALLAGFIAAPIFIFLPTLFLVAVFSPALRFLAHGLIFVLIFYFFHRVYKRSGRKGLLLAILLGLLAWALVVIFILWAVFSAIKYFT